MCVCVCVHLCVCVRARAYEDQRLRCLKRREECLGDCPDAAYYGPHVLEDNNTVQLLRLERDDELHLIMLVNHRTLNVSVYGSIAVLKPAIRWAESLDKTHMKVRATALGVTSFDFPASKFVSWVFTRNAQHCTLLVHWISWHFCGCLSVFSTLSQPVSVPPPPYFLSLSFLLCPCWRGLICQKNPTQLAAVALYALAVAPIARRTIRPCCRTYCLCSCCVPASAPPRVCTQCTSPLLIALYSYAASFGSVRACARPFLQTYTYIHTYTRACWHCQKGRL